MRTTFMAVAVLALAALADAASVERASMEARRLFEALRAEPRVERARAEEVAGEAVGWSVFSVAQAELSPGKAGTPLGAFTLAERLDAQRDMLVKQLGANTYEIGIAGDSEFNILYLTARREGVLALQRVNRIADFIGNGVDVVIEPGVVYNIRLKLDFLNPLRNSTVFLTPAQGTQGPPHAVKTGELVDRLKAKAYQFRLGRAEYAVLYTTDVDAGSDRLGDTRSLVFVNDAGLNTKAWRVAESALAVGQPVKVALGSGGVSVLKTADGRIELYDGGI